MLQPNRPFVPAPRQDTAAYLLRTMQWLRTQRCIQASNSIASHACAISVKAIFCIKKETARHTPGGCRDCAVENRCPRCAVGWEGQPASDSPEHVPGTERQAPCGLQQLPFLAWPGGQKPPWPPPAPGSITTEPLGVYTAQPPSNAATKVHPSSFFISMIQE